MTTRSTPSGATEFVNDEGEILGRVEPVLADCSVVGRADTWDARVGRGYFTSIGLFISQQNAIAAVERHLNGPRLKDPTR